jgi:hypothetical protein
MNAEVASRILVEMRLVLCILTWQCELSSFLYTVLARVRSIEGGEEVTQALAN